MKPKSKILIIAGSDSSGGAGIQADIKTVTSLGSYAMTAITAVTSQNTLGVKSIHEIPVSEIYKQIDTTIKDIKPDAIKIGMLYSEKVVKCVLDIIKKYKLKKIILDPVMVSTSGHNLISPKCINYIRSKMIPQVTLITPNIPEAEILSNTKINNSEDMIKAIKIIKKLGASNILIKGGHLKTKKIFDIFHDNNNLLLFRNKKILTKNTHGTGCTLSSAIATYYSCGKTLKNSCYLAIKYVNGAIKTAPNYGSGNGPINHINSIKLK